MDAKIQWAGQEWDRIVRFDCHIVELGYHDGPGGYFTALPISPLSYRRQNPTQASVRIFRGHRHMVFEITTDYGDRKEMRIPFAMKAEITAAVDAARAMELLVTP